MTVKEIFGIDNCDIVSSYDITERDKTYKAVSLKYNGDVPSVCPKCGCKMYKHGERPIEITDTPMGGMPVQISVSFARGRCSSEKCKNIWKPQIDGIDEKHKMTNRAVLAIAQQSLRTTFSEVAQNYMLSENTIKNIFVEFVEQYKQNLRFKTPAFLGIDEIKIKKMGEVTVITDLEHHTMFDMLLGRNQKTLTEYFMNMPNRENVLWVCSDMYRPFQKSIADAMPNAQWVIDHFHLVKMANDCVDVVRKCIQAKMSKDKRIKTKKGLAFTLRTRLNNLTLEEAQKIRACRNSDELKPLAIAYDLKEAFFNIYDDNPMGIDNAHSAFIEWEQSIPLESIYDSFRSLAGTVKSFEEQIFNYWKCPIAITNGFTECSNRLIREDNIKGRGYSFEVLRARTLFRKSNLRTMIENSLLTIGPQIPKEGPVFRYDCTNEAEDDFDEYEEYNTALSDDVF